MRYQHPPVETLYEQLDKVISARMAEIRTAYRIAADNVPGAGMPPFDQLWDMATRDVRRAMDDVDPEHIVRVPMIGATRDEQPSRTPDSCPACLHPSVIDGRCQRCAWPGALAPWHPGDGPTGKGDADLEAIAAAHGERPWCGAPADLGGQQPCPILEPCGPGVCKIGR